VNRAKQIRLDQGAVNRAKQIRLDQGAGLADTAKAAGLSTRTLKKIENGEDVNAAPSRASPPSTAVKASELLAPAHFETPREGRMTAHEAVLAERRRQRRIARRIERPS
jgi:transcriptional regulator with XRE-family HTH domain